ncbi:kinase-like domain-containing protein [Scleroderma yunnanense]
MAPEQPSQDSSPPSNFNPSNILSELQGVLDQRFAAIDLGDRISRDTSKLIGSGTYGYVYGGTLNPNQTKVAVKSVRFGNKGALPVLKEVLKEVRNAFDYVQNTDVDLRPLILGIANGMYYLHTHEQGLIIHGDLKGPNVLVSDDGQALLNDFGFSHLSQASLSLAVEQHPGGFWNDDTERERPSPDVSCSRMTDEWWSICLLCWVRDPSQRAPMLNVVRNIRTIQTESKVVTQSLPCKVSSVRVNHLDDNASPGAWDPRNILNELVQRASRYCINLDGLVSKDHTGSRRLEGYAIISSGTLQLNEELMTRWTASSGFLKYGNTIKVAIKTSRGTLLEVVDVEAIMKFLKELHSWSKLNHENVLPLIGIATQFDYTLSIVSPWMKKGDARNFVRDKSVDPRPLIEGIASGLCYLHNCIPTPLYHEDVKGYVYSRTG